MREESAGPPMPDPRRTRSTWRYDATCEVDWRAHPRLTAGVIAHDPVHLLHAQMNPFAMATLPPAWLK